MNDFYLFHKIPLRNGFQFPQSYLNLAELAEEELPEIAPWWWLAPYEDSSLYWLNTLQQQFPSRHLIPFARHGGSDDVVCFDASEPATEPSVVCIHGFCSPGHELRGHADTFSEWLSLILSGTD
jgi:hypothetical protein